jgi:excisionase family DNA binding protein
MVAPAERRGNGRFSHNSAVFNTISASFDAFSASARHPSASPPRATLHSSLSHVVAWRTLGRSAPPYLGLGLMEVGLTELRTIAETTAALRVSRSSVDRLLKTGELESVRIGARRLIPLASIERLAAPTSAQGS